VIPCYEGARFLGEAIESCLGQTYTRVEIIVVDDASPDDCARIAEGYASRDDRVRVIRRRKNGGVARAFNTGFQAARGEYFSRLAQDDLFREDAISLMHEQLRGRADLGLVYCDMQKIDENANVTGLLEAKDPEGWFSQGGTLGLCVMWPRKVWNAVGRFDPFFDKAEDLEYWLRLSQRFAIEKIAGEAPVYVRFHTGMASEVYRMRQWAAATLARRLHREDWSESHRGSLRPGGRAKPRRELAAIYWDASWMFYHADDMKAALRCAWRAARYRPYRLSYWRHVLGAALRVVAGTSPARAET